MEPDAVQKWRGAARACIENGERLLSHSEFLEFEEVQGTSFALAVIAQEEFAKAFLFVLISQNVLPAHPLILRAAKDHISKQLVCLVMDHMNPDWDEFIPRLETSFEDAAKDRFPSHVADAMNILRHERIESWQLKV